jgi:hypothetical protein
MPPDYTHESKVGWDVAQVVESLSSKHKALSSNSSTAKTKKEYWHFVECIRYTAQEFPQQQYPTAACLAVQSTLMQMRGSCLQQLYSLEVTCW